MSGKCYYCDDYQVIDKAKAQYGMTPETQQYHIRHNLEAVRIHLSYRDGPESVCVKTLGRVIEQLSHIETILESE